VVVLPPRDRGGRNSTETQQSGHAPRPGPEVKSGKSSTKDGTPERLRCGTIQVSSCTNVSPPQRGGEVPTILQERWAEMARQLPRGVPPSGRPQSSRQVTFQSSRLTLWLGVSPGMHFTHSPCYLVLIRAVRFFYILNRKSANCTAVYNIAKREGFVWHRTWK